MECLVRLQKLAAMMDNERSGQRVVLCAVVDIFSLCIFTLASVLLYGLYLLHFCPCAEEGERVWPSSDYTKQNPHELIDVPAGFDRLTIQLPLPTNTRH